MATASSFARLLVRLRVYIEDSESRQDHRQAVSCALLALGKKSGVFRVLSQQKQGKLEPGRRRSPNGRVPRYVIAADQTNFRKMPNTTTIRARAPLFALQRSTAGPLRTMPPLPLAHPYCPPAICRVFSKTVNMTKCNTSPFSMLYFREILPTPSSRKSPPQARPRLRRESRIPPARKCQSYATPCGADAAIPPSSTRWSESTSRWCPPSQARGPARWRSG